MPPSLLKPIGPRGRITGRSEKRKGLGMTAWILYLTFLLAPLVMLVIFMAG